MDRYIGLDVHAASTTFAVVGPSGKRLGTHVVETNGLAVVEQLKRIAANGTFASKKGRKARGCTRSYRRTPRRSS